MFKSKWIWLPKNETMHSPPTQLHYIKQHFASLTSVGGLRAMMVAHVHPNHVSKFSVQYVAASQKCTC